jgi:hypothetical protein
VEGSEWGGRWHGEGRRRGGLTGGGAEARPDSEAAHGHASLPSVSSSSSREGKVEKGK